MFGPRLGIGYGNRLLHVWRKAKEAGQNIETLAAALLASHQFGTVRVCKSRVFAIIRVDVSVLVQDRI